MFRQKLVVISTLFTLNFLLTPSVFADNDYVPSTAVPLPVIVQNLESAGYKHIKEVEYDDGYYQAEIINENGHKIDLKINPMTGKVNPPKNINTSFISMSKAISTAEKAGFKDFTSISLEHGIYKIKAHDKQSQETKIILNAKTGKVIYSELDN